jgi:hypothetical protein
MSFPNYSEIEEDLRVLSIESEEKLLTRFQYYVDLALSRVDFNEPVEGREEEDRENQEYLSRSYWTLNFIANEFHLPLATMIFDAYNEMYHSDYASLEGCVPEGYSEFLQQLVLQLHEKGREKELMSLQYAHRDTISQLALLLQHRPLMREFANAILNFGRWLRLENDLRDPQTLLLLLKYADAEATDQYFRDTYRDSRHYYTVLKERLQTPETMETVTRWSQSRFDMIKKIRRDLIITKYRYPPGGRPLAKESKLKKEDFECRGKFRRRMIICSIYTLDADLTKFLLQFGIHPTVDEVVEAMKLLPTHPILNPRKEILMRLFAIDRRGPLLALRQLARIEDGVQDEKWKPYAERIGISTADW